VGDAMNHRFQSFFWAITATLILFVSNGQHSGQTPERRPDDLRVLFIGNSLTYSNELPSMIEALAKASGQREFVHETIAFPNFSLEDHWNDGRALKAIRNGKWDFVVMQQGPSAGREGREVLLKYAKLLSDDIKKAGGTPAMYMVWPASNRAFDFEGVRETYKLGADASNGLFLPVGQAWLSALGKKRELTLYSSDGFHPSVVGTYLAALIIYEQLYDRTPIGLPAKFTLRSGTKIDISSHDAVILQKTASEVNAMFKSMVKLSH
jgi:hypothetical protein